MQKNTLLLGLGVIVVIAVGYFFMTKSAATENAMPTPSHVATEGMPADMPGMEMPATAPATAPAGSVKEFTMTAYYDEKGKWFSLKEMTVKKGDTVRVNVTNTKGMHNFTIDELGVAQNLPLNEQVVVEFTASKAGDFVYYCSMPGHRAGGQWGTLHVTE